MRKCRLLLYTYMYIYTTIKGPPDVHRVTWNPFSRRHRLRAPGSYASHPGRGNWGRSCKGGENTMCIFLIYTHCQSWKKSPMQSLTVCTFPTSSYLSPIPFAFPPLFPFLYESWLWVSKEGHLKKMRLVIQSQEGIWPHTPVIGLLSNPSGYNLLEVKGLHHKANGWFSKFKEADNHYFKITIATGSS